MFDLGASELLLIVVVAIVVIGPKDLPIAMRTAGRWIGRIRKVSSHFRAGIDAMVREAELQEMEEKWRKQNAAIMQAHPEPQDAAPQTPSAAAEAPVLLPEVADPLAAHLPETADLPARERQAEPQLPLPPP